MRLKLFAAALLLAVSPASAVGGVFADELGRCVVNATTVEDRTALMRWMFLTAAANPAFADLTAISETQRRDGFRSAARVYDRLLLRACRRETVQTMRNEGPAGMETGFQALGMVAGREMMQSAAGTGSMDELLSLMDTAGLEALHREASQPPAER